MIIDDPRVQVMFELTEGIAKAPTRALPGAAVPAAAAAAAAPARVAVAEGDSGGAAAAAASASGASSGSSPSYDDLMARFNALDK